MKANTLFFYSLKENSIKKQLIDLLSIKWPLSVNEMHKLICIGQKVKVSYQAIRKAVKQLQEEGCLISKDKNKFQINLEWLNELSTRIKQIEANYKGQFVFQKTVFAKESGNINVLIAKDGIVRDKWREEMLHHLLRELIPIFREEFGPHNIFQKEENEVVDYLMRLQKQHEILIFLRNDKVIGGTVLEKKDESLTENHMIWKLKHFALNRQIGKPEEKIVFNEVKERLQQKSKSMKIQLNLSEIEKRYIKMFKGFGFKREGTLENHYRVGEKMFIYSKLFSN